MPEAEELRFEVFGVTPGLRISQTGYGPLVIENLHAGVTPIYLARLIHHFWAERLRANGAPWDGVDRDPMGREIVGADLPIALAEARL